MQPRFAYEEAESILDNFAQHPKRVLAFKRAYRKLKFMVAAYAYLDFDNRRDASEERNELALSYAWEDVQMAFTGHGEMALGGCILQMWANLRSKEHASFRTAIIRAFKAAEEATPPEAPRRYLHQYRTKPPRLPSEDWNLPCILPMSGVLLTEWAVDSDEDPEEVAEQWMWLELADRNEHTGYDPQGAVAVAAESKYGHLRLVED